ncbi:Uma2 family endonuclease [Scytonema sp. NUACC26]|uniref:Uma2 family endonuclease n=1 Tax=Scytonema sp. NUACC26 TaxID=3140176 RepID=UPI0034DBE07E
MIQSLPKLVTFDEFIEWYPENSEQKYEFHNGIIVEMPKPTRPHSDIAGFLSGKLFIEIERLQLPYSIPKECVIKPRDNGGYEPDVIVLDKQQVSSHETRWKKESIITRSDSIRLIVEVVSTNWEDDYALKLEEYEAFGIGEYWIVDYLALGGRRFIGNPKQRTISVYSLVNGVYQLSQFRGDERILSPTFPELTLTAQQIFDAGNAL